MPTLLETLFKRHNKDAEVIDGETLRQASAALLFEVIRADDKLEDSEVDRLIAILKKRWQLDDGAANALREQARQKVEAATDIYHFTSVLRDKLEYAKRVTLITQMWDLAYSDGELAPDEEYTIRKVADLLYVDHSDFIHGKIKGMS